MEFYAWLRQQRGRNDRVGDFATLVLASRLHPLFPKTKSDLHLVLLWCEAHPAMRPAAKQAHREWRQTREERAS